MMTNFTLKTRIYLISTFIVGFFCLINSILSNENNDLRKNILSILVLCFVFILSECISTKGKKVDYNIYVIVIFPLYYLYNIQGAMLGILIGSLFKIYKINNEYVHIFNTPYYKTLFNACNKIIPVYVAHHFLNYIGFYRYDSFLLINMTIIAIIFYTVLFIINYLLLIILLKLLNKETEIYIFDVVIKYIFNLIIFTPISIYTIYISMNFEVALMFAALIPIVIVRYTYKLYTESQMYYIQTIELFMNTLEARDKYTEGHSRRVAELAIQLGKELKLRNSKLEKLRVGALLHDIGKIGISDVILNKPGKLTDEEFDAIKMHPEISFKLVKKIRKMEYITDIARHHHERFDGKGYPDGKDAEELEIEVFIVQLADAVDAMISDRPYRKGLPIDVVLDEIRKHSGSQFHPDVVEAYLNLVNKQSITQ